MIVLKRELSQALLEHLRKEYPNEGCGLLAGKCGTVIKVHPVKNSDASPVSYFMDPKEELAAFRRMREDGHELLGIYHSHPTSEAYPSEKDRTLAFYDEVFYLIVSLRDPQAPVLRAFWLRGGKIEEDKISTAE